MTAGKVARILDLTTAGWVAYVVDGERELLLARHGGLAERLGEREGERDGEPEAERWRWSPAPIVQAAGAAIEGGRRGERLWVASELGQLWERRDGVWHLHPLPELRGGLDLLLAHEGRLFLTRRGRLYERIGSRLSALGAAPPGPGTVSRAEDGRPVIFANHRAYLFDGERFLPILLSEAGARSAWSTVRAARAARGGGVWLVDEGAGLYHRLADGRVRCLRKGRISRWLRHTYPDPEPDEFTDAVIRAAIGREGTVVALRASNPGDGLTYSKVRPGGERVSQSRPADPHTPQQVRLALDASEVPVLPLPRLMIRGLEGAEIRIAGGGPGFEVELGEAVEEALCPTRGALVHGEERWSLDGGALVIEAFERALRLPLQARALCLLPRGTAYPQVLDELGGLYTFDGAALRREACSLGLDRPAYLARVGGALRLADDLRVVEIRLPPAGSAQRSASIAATQEALRSAVSEIHLFPLPLRREEAEASLGRFARLGRAGATVTLAELFTGEEDAPGPTAPEEHARALIEGLGPGAAYYRLDGEGGRVLAWVALLEEEALICAGSRDAGAVAEALRASEDS